MDKTIDSESLRQAMRQWTTGVTVVSSFYEGLRHGMTVNSFTSISLDPPLVLVSLERATRTHGLILQSGTFGITLLAQEQKEISDRFAGRVAEHLDRFEGLETHTLITGSSFLMGGLAWLDCLVVNTYDAGSHTLFIGQVLDVRIYPGPPPLVYYDRAYRSIDHYG